MRVLLTRAESDAVRTRKRLEALGHQVVVSPVIEIVGTGAAWPSGVIDAALATSGHAFGVRMDGPTPEVRRLLPLLLVGARTKELAVAHGFLGQTTVAKNAAALAAEIARSQTGPKRIVYLAGRDRKPDIESALRHVGHQLDVVEVYEARPIETPSQEAARAFRHHGIHSVMHFSRRSAALLLEMASAQSLDVRSLAHFCLSDDVAVPLQETGVERVYVAANPNEDSLLELLHASGRPSNDQK